MILKKGSIVRIKPGEYYSATVYLDGTPIQLGTMPSRTLYKVVDRGTCGSCRLRPIDRRYKIAADMDTLAIGSWVCDQFLTQVPPKFKLKAKA